MSEGLSLAAAAAECDVHRQRVYDWRKTRPEFADTIQLAMGKRQARLERQLLSAKDGPSVTSAIFALKNASPEDWRDKHEVEHSATGDLAALIADRRKQAAILDQPNPEMLTVIPNGQ